VIGPGFALALACAGVLDGHVVDATTHAPVAGATVALDGEIRALTDEAGRFELVGLCPGPVALEVVRDDYAPDRRTLAVARSASVEIALAPVAGEVIAITGETPVAIDMRSTTTLSGEALERTRGEGLAEALADVPGVSQLKAGSGLGKPIVRGQFGRRLLLLVDAVRHRSQDWGLDHAPEVDPYAAERITVVRGAAGVRYGPDAIGGAVLVDPPALPRTPGVRGLVHLVGTTNGLGGAIAARVQGASARWPGLAARLEGSASRRAGQVTPDYALDNTGAREWSLGGTLGYRTGEASYRAGWTRYDAALGVCACLRIESIEDFDDQLARDRPVDADRYQAELAIDRPRQTVTHDVGLVRGRWRLGGLGDLTATYAFQHDRRREYEIVRDATTGPQFDFRLYTHDLDVALEHRPVHLSDHWHLEGTLGAVGVAQDHAYAGLPLVPGHRSFGAGAYAIERLVGHDVELEAGVRYDATSRGATLARGDFQRLVRSGQLPADACGGAAVGTIECRSTFHTVSASVGALRQLTNAWSLKLDLSTASRPPNPDEQYLNGTSPTFPVLGLGKPDLGPETTYAASATTSYQGERITAEASLYANRISDYVEFAPAIGPDGEPIFDVLVRGTFPRFVTRPVDAVFYGVDGGIAARPVPWLELGLSAAAVRARNVRDDAYLAFVPADQARATLGVRRAADADLGETYLTLIGTFVRKQTRTERFADLAPPPPGYVLLGAEAGTAARLGGRTIKLALQGTNLLDARYRDYTSLMRYFADQPGWSASARATIELD
jgi:iron complex outermembrane receptor protein